VEITGVKLLKFALSAYSHPITLPVYVLMFKEAVLPEHTLAEPVNVPTLEGALIVIVPLTAVSV
jgi:hypothetical protein